MASLTLSIRRAATAPNLLMNKFPPNPFRSSFPLRTTSLLLFSSKTNNIDYQIHQLMTDSDNEESDFDNIDDDDRMRSDSASRGYRRDSSPYILLSDVSHPYTKFMDFDNSNNGFVKPPPSRVMEAGGGGGGRWGRMKIKEDEGALYLKIDFPGLGKDDVKVTVEQHTLMIKGKAEKEDDDDDDDEKSYSRMFGFTANLYKLGETKAEMKNGVLRVSIPKVKEEEKDVIQVKVD